MDSPPPNRLIEKVSLLIMVFWAAILGIRLLIAPLEAQLIFAALSLFSTFLIVYLCVIYLKAPRIGGIVLLGIFMASILLITWLSGGIKSPSSISFPLIPVITALLFGRVFAWASCLIMVMATMGFYLSEITNASGVIDSTDELEDRLIAFWVVLSTLACAVFATFFHTENQRLNDALKNQARIDYLTGLPNKRAIEEALRREFTLAKRTGGWISVIMLDIDFFKRYNDLNGHAKGDECLKLIANTLLKNLRRADDFIGRYGGEEFIVLLPDTNPDACMYIAENMRTSVEELDHTYGEVLSSPVTITLGCYSTRGDHIHNMDDLVSRADRALYDGKRMGRNRVISAVDKKIDIHRPSPIANLNERRLRRRSDPEPPA